MAVLSEQGRVDFPSRLSARAVMVGSTLTLVLLTLFLALGGGFGLLPAGPRVDAGAVREAGTGLVIWGALSWIAAAFAGAFVSALSARASVRLDGLLHGIATWAIACAAAGILSCVWLMSAITREMVGEDLIGVFWTRGAFWSFVVADALGLGAALAGGLLGARSEARTPSRAESTREGGMPVARRPAPQPA